MIAALTANVKKLRWLSWHQHRIIWHSTESTLIIDLGQHGDAISKVRAPTTINHLHDREEEPMSTTKIGLDALLTPESSVLILIDHQPFQFANLHSHEPTMVVNNVIGLAKAAKVAVTSEWRRDWAREATVRAIGEMLAAHGGASGVAFAWEMQLLASAAGPKKQAVSMAVA
jgi:hypothetical protein